MRRSSVQLLAWYEHKATSSTRYLPAVFFEQDRAEDKLKRT